MTALTINVVGTPAPQGSKRGFVVNGRVVMTESSKKVKPWRQDVRQAALDAQPDIGWKAFLGPVELAIVFYMPRPKAHYGTGRNAGVLKATAPTYVDKIPDLSKLIRSTEDALSEARVWGDDAQVARLVVEKRYADAATGARITVCPLDSVPAAHSPVAAGTDSASGHALEGEGSGRPTTPEGVLW